MKPLNVYCIGSCRTYVPLSILHDMKIVQNRHITTDWHTHSTRDTLQKIEHVTGRRRIEDWQKPLLATDPHQYTFDAGHRKMFDDIDYTIVEISSRRSLTFGDFEIQQWCWTNLARECGCDLDRFTKEMLRLPSERDLSCLPATAPDILVRIAKEGQLRHFTGEEIIADLEIIATRVNGKQIYIPPITVPLADGTLIPERAMICDALQTFCKNNGHTYFNPAPFIIAAGRESALLDEGHYTQPFQTILAGHLINVICPTH